MRDRGERLDIDDVDERVAERLGVKQLGIFADGAPEILRLIRRDERRLDAKLFQVDIEERMRAAVERGRRHDVVAARAKCEECGDLCGLTRRTGKRGTAAFERSHALLEHRDRRIGDARVDVAESLEVEEARRVLGRVEDERGGLVDRRRARPGGGIRDLPGVQAKRLEAEFAVRHRLRF